MQLDFWRIVVEKIVNNYLISFDFDDTVAKTREKGPNGIGVNEAYNLAVVGVFGERGEQLYNNELGGLRNRAPTELVKQLLDLDKNLLKTAENFFYENVERLLAIFPEKIDESKIHADVDDNQLIDLLTWMLVAEKCSYLSSEIGKELTSGDIWPRPCTGFIDFYKYINEINKQGKTKIDTAIISSGHTEFIKRTFNVYGLSVPDYLITDDEMRKINLPVSRKTKPGTYPFMRAHKSWIENTGVARFDKDRMIYFGDDPNKDGLMAKNCRVVFGNYNDDLGSTFSKTTSGCCFGDWNLIKDLMIRGQGEMKRGVSWRDIINYEE